MPNPMAYAQYIGAPTPDNVVTFPNPDEVQPRRFFIEERRFYSVFAVDEVEAFDKFCEMTEEETREAEVEGGGHEVYAADN